MPICHTGNVVTSGRKPYKSDYVTYEVIKEHADKGCTLIQIVRNLKATESFVRKVFADHPQGTTLKLQVAGNSKNNPFKNKK